MSLTKILATLGGDLWISSKCFALWPWPAIVRNYPESKLTGTDYRHLTKILLPGDILLTRGDLYRLSNRGIPEKQTYLKHLAVYVGGADGVRKNEFINSAKRGTMYERCIIHAVSEGVVCQDIWDLFRHCDEIVAVRPWLNNFQKNKIIDTAYSLLGKEYDFKFSANNEALYCTELGATCLGAAGIKTPKMVKVRNSLIGLILPLDRFKGDVWVADSFVNDYKIIYKSESVK